uniref:Fic/DOC family protein n=1 Tax=Castellaniella defragrans TaxID=75697 RepID=UPI0033423511
MSRYDISGQQNNYQEGSGGEVLANKLGIVRREDMNEAELMLLRKLYFAVLREQPVEGPLTVRLIRDWHRRWLGNLYPWAGFERSVNMSKDGFLFAAAARIPQLLDEYGRRILARYTPCKGMDRNTLAEAIAVTHVEFILIHPFREGNGRISRLMADVMAGQAGWGPLDYSAWEAERPQYIHAIQSGLSGDYAPMRGKVEEALGPLSG